MLHSKKFKSWPGHDILKLVNIFIAQNTTLSLYLPMCFSFASSSHM